MDLNKKSVKQQGGAMIPEQPGMQQQPQVDPQVMQISEMFSAAVQEGQQPQEVLMGLMQQEVDQNIIGQALMQLGYEEEAIISLFEDVQKLQQPQEPSPQQITNNPQQLARAEEIQKEAPGMDMNITSIDQAKSGIEIKPENKGKFTRWAKARGMSVSEAYGKVMANKDNYPPSVVKMANFAKNAAGWQKEEGGEFESHFMYKGDRKIRARDMATHLRLKEAGYNHEAPKAADGVETGAVIASEEGTDNTKMMSDFLNASKSEDAVKTKNKGLISNLEDEGILEPGPMYINPAIFNNNEFNLGKAANVALTAYEDMFSGKDKDGDGVKDGSFRDWRGKHINNKMQKMANATYDVKFDLSDENKNAAATWFKQFQVENPELAQQKDALGNIIKTEADKLLDDINAPSAVKKISDDLLEKWQTGTSETKAYIESILKKKGQEIPSEYKVDPMSAGGKDPGATSKDPQEVDLDPGFDMESLESIENNDPGFDQFIPKDYKGPLDPGFNKGVPDFSNYQQMLVKYGAEIPNMQMAGPVANQKLSFKEWVMQDPVTRGGANGQQLYAQYEAEFDNPFNPTPPVAQTNDVPAQRSAADLFTDIKGPEVDANYGGVGGFLDRALNSTVATAFGDLSNFAVGAADVANDYFDEINKKKAQEELRGDLVADNIYGTKTDAFNKRGTFDINSGLMGSEGDATTGLYMSQEGGPIAAKAGLGRLLKEGVEQLPGALRKLKTFFGSSDKANPYVSFKGFGADDIPQNGPNAFNEYMNSFAMIDPAILATMTGLPFLEMFRGDRKEEEEKRKFDNEHRKSRGMTSDGATWRNQQGGEIVSVDSKMLAKLIAAGADIEKL